MFKVLLYLNPLSEAEAQRFADYCVRHPNVLHLIKTVADWDYESLILKRRMSAQCTRS